MRKIIKLPPLANLLIGIALVAFSIIRIVPLILTTMAADAIMAASEPVEAVCKEVEHGLLYTNLTLEYEYNGEDYEAVLENQTLGEQTLNISKGSKITLYVAKNDPSTVFLRESVYNEAFSSARNKVILRNLPYFLIGLVALTWGILGLIRQRREKLADQRFRESILNKPKTNDYGGMYGSADVPPQPVYSDPAKKSSFNSSYSTPSYQQPLSSDNKISGSQPFSAASSASPSYGSGTSSSSPSYGSGAPSYKPHYSSEPSSEGYTSLDFSHLPPSKPMRIDDDEFKAPKTIEPDEPETNDNTSFKPFASSAPAAPSAQPSYSTPSAQPSYSAPAAQPSYSAPAAQPQNPAPAPSAEPEQEMPSAPAAPSEPVDLSSIIKRGTDDPFNVNPDDYQVDPALAALIKKGTEDPFNQSADSYEVDPALAALIKSGQDDPFANLPKKDKPKRKKKKPQY